jgi:hypothetical protein
MFANLRGFYWSLGVRGAYSPAMASDDQRAFGIIGWFGPHVFNALLPVFSEEIEAKAVGFGFNFVDELLPQCYPLGRIDQALKDGVLHSLAAVEADLCDVA